MVVDGYTVLGQFMCEKCGSRINSIIRLDMIKQASELTGKSVEDCEAMARKMFPNMQMMHHCNANIGVLSCPN